MVVSKAFGRSPFRSWRWTLLQYREQTNASPASWPDAKALGVETR